MSKKLDLTGQKFSRLTALEPTRLANRTAWICMCDCGNRCTVDTGNLRAGYTKSCGCLCREKIKERKTKHGCSRKGAETTEYRSWAAMKGRCLNPSNNRYENYTKLGVIICNRWLNSFENFLKDMGEKPSPSHSIERIDNDGNYDPGNCKWGTPLEQAANTRNLKWFGAFNKKTRKNYKSDNQHEFARQHGLDYRRIFDSLHDKRKCCEDWRFEFIEGVK